MDSSSPFKTRGTFKPSDGVFEMYLQHKLELSVVSESRLHYCVTVTKIDASLSVAGSSVSNS